MKYLLILIFGMFSLISFSQSNSRKMEVGLFVGEGTGVQINKPILSNFTLEFNIGINELFLNYNFAKKYEPNRINQVYDNMFSFSINLIYQKAANSNSSIIYRGGIGWQNRFVTNYKYQLNPLVYPNWGGFTGPYTPLTINYYFGLNYFIGLGYKLNTNLTTFIDFGGYTELFYSFPWPNPQFRVGLKYQLKEK